MTTLHDCSTSCEARWPTYPFSSLLSVSARALISELLLPIGLVAVNLFASAIPEKYKTCLTLWTFGGLSSWLKYVLIASAHDPCLCEIAIISYIAITLVSDLHSFHNLDCHESLPEARGNERKCCSTHLELAYVCSQVPLEPFGSFLCASWLFAGCLLDAS